MATYRVAIVDQDSTFIAYVEELLVRHGYTTQSYNSLEGTYDAISADPPDVALIGLHFPNSRHGLDLVTLLKARPETRDLVMLLTSHDLPFLEECGQRLRERAVPAIWLLPKPLEEPQILGFLRDALGDGREQPGQQ